MASLAKKLWSLSAHQRLLVLLCSGVFPATFRPWSQANHSIAVNVYSGAAAMLVLAVLPRRIRLLYALGIALVVAIGVLLFGPAVFGVQV
ncbi:hypothetical protein [Dyella sp.]|uniref:hypothetical protein n=1 Tax=Dyella sp. TaxID=1869338 RepID=UPI003F7EE171